LAQLGSGFTRDYWQSTSTNQTLTYPLLGYSERPDAIWNLTNLSIGLLAVGATVLIVALTKFRAESPRAPILDNGPVTRKCANCGQENLFFAVECRRCGNVVRDEAPKVQSTVAIR